jgi:5-methylthioadenosine/S-adenosylhomocysteine deaminase
MSWSWSGSWVDPVPSEPGDLVVRGGRVLLPSGEMREADVEIHRGVITRIGRDIEATGISALDAGGTVVVPGFINAHTHSQNNLVKGRVDAWPLESVLSLGPALNGNRNPQDHYLSALLGAAEMLMSGITSVFELFIDAFPNVAENVAAVLCAYRDVGLRAVVAPAVIDVDIMQCLEVLAAGRSAVASTPGTAAQLRRLDDIRTLAGHEWGRVVLGVAPTIPILCSADLLDAVGDLVRDRALPVQAHVAETKFQAVAARALFGESTVQRLHRHTLLTENTVAAHGVWLERGDPELLAGKGVTVSHNPASNMKLGSGAADVRRLLDRGVHVAVGTDGCTTSDNLNYFDALRMSAFSSRLFDRPSSQWLTARAVLDLAWRGGADAMASVARVGSLEAGRSADLVLLDCESIHLTPLNDLLSQIVYSETGSAVRDVIVDGNIVLRDRRLPLVDMQALAASARSAASRMWTANGATYDEAVGRAAKLEAMCRQIADADVEVVPDHHHVPSG